MTPDKLESIRAWFDAFVRSFRTDDGYLQMNYDLKEDHTRRVCANALEIGRELGLDEGRLALIEGASALHDVGRFEQMKIYRTFLDEDSEDHASLSVRILEREGVLEGMEEGEKRLLLDAVRFHNAWATPDDADGETLLLMRIVRDADKLDVLKVVTQYYEEREEHPNPALDDKITAQGGFSPAVLRSIRENRCARRKELQSMDDVYLARLSWVFDLNFEASLRRFRERGFLEKILERLPDNAEVREVRAEVEGYLDVRLAR